MLRVLIPLCLQGLAMASDSGLEDPPALMPESQPMKTQEAMDLSKSVMIAQESDDTYFEVDDAAPIADVVTSIDGGDTDKDIETSVTGEISNSSGDYNKAQTPLQEGCKCKSEWVFYGVTFHGCMDLVDPPWCFTQGECDAAEWSEGGDAWWINCVPDTSTNDNAIGTAHAVVAAGEIGHLATPPPYIKFNQEQHMRIRGPTGGTTNWDWIGRMTALYPANKVPHIHTFSHPYWFNGQMKIDTENGSGELEASTKAYLETNSLVIEDARCACQHDWTYNGDNFRGCMLNTNHEGVRWCFANDGCDLQGMVGSYDKVQESNWMLCQADGTGYFPARPNAPNAHATQEETSGAVVKFSRTIYTIKPVPTYNKGFIIAAGGALAAAAAVMTVWMVLLRKRGDESEDDGSWNPDEAYNMAREEEVVFDRTSNLGAQMRDFNGHYADPSNPDPSWTGSNAQGNSHTLRTPMKNRASVGSYGSTDGVTPMKWTRTTPTRRSPGHRMGGSDGSVDSLA